MPEEGQGGHFGQQKHVSILESSELPIHLAQCMRPAAPTPLGTSTTVASSKAMRLHMERHAKPRILQGQGERVVGAEERSLRSMRSCTGSNSFGYMPRNQSAANCSLEAGPVMQGVEQRLGRLRGSGGGCRVS